MLKFLIKWLMLFVIDELPINFVLIRISIWLCTYLIDSTNNKFNYREFTIKNIYKLYTELLLNEIELINFTLHKYKLPRNKFFIHNSNLNIFNSYLMHIYFKFAYVKNLWLSIINQFKDLIDHQIFLIL